MRRLRLLGIPIRVHFTFLILVVWYGYVSAQRGLDPWRGILFLLLLFACVVLHELGHALMARRFGVATREIVLYPIGGVARLEGMTGGKTELFIALAGPAVNLGLVGVLFALLAASGAAWPTAEEMVQGQGVVPLVAQLLLANVLLFGFNLIPAFPMDGGRVLRALLSFPFGEELATRIAGRIGQGIAVLFAVVGVMTSPILLLIAVFVFFGAGQEVAFHRSRSALRGRRVLDVMLTRFETVRPQDTLQQAAELLLASSQTAFPVLDGWGRVAGLLSSAGLLSGLKERGGDGAVLEVMAREVPTVAPETELEQVAPLLRGPGGAVLVEKSGELVGLVTSEHLGRSLELLRASPVRNSAPAMSVRGGRAP